ncbi:MAG TPA: ferredoxin reductase [Xanthobacteraceae bacterium]|nr:ferredoxin reductase [Xanthobacteraceae bacterium]
MPETEVSAPKRVQWQTAEVREIVEETPRVKSLALDVAGWPGHRAGQRVDVRLTAEDGYQAQRSYSIASAPETPRLMLTVERIEEGEVSPYLTDEVRIGDQFQLRGPIGGHFVWTADLGGPLFLVAGGSGIVPLMAMLRHRAAAKSAVEATLLYSSRTFEDIIYRAELDALAKDGKLRVFHTLTRKQPAGWRGGSRRIDRNMLAEVGFRPALRPRTFICGPMRLVEDGARHLLELGYDRALIKTERFGPTGA